MTERARCPECGKLCFSAREADRILSHARRPHSHRTRKNVPKRKYWCAACGSYHLTHLAHYVEMGGGKNGKGF